MVTKILKAPDGSQVMLNALKKKVIICAAR